MEFGRAVAAGNSSPEARHELAVDLQFLGDAALVAAARSTGPARKAALEQEIAAYAECQRISADLEREGVKPDTNAINLGLVAEEIESAREKLAEFQASNQAARR